jgi:hypothetical protein
MNWIPPPTTACLRQSLRTGLSVSTVRILGGAAAINATRKVEAVTLFAGITSRTKASLLVRSMPTHGHYLHSALRTSSMWK